MRFGRNSSLTSVPRALRAQPSGTTSAPHWQLFVTAKRCIQTPAMLRRVGVPLLSAGGESENLITCIAGMGTAGLEPAPRSVRANPVSYSCELLTCFHLHFHQNVLPLHHVPDVARLSGLSAIVSACTLNRSGQGEDLNLRPPAYETGKLPTALPYRIILTSLSLQAYPPQPSRQSFPVLPQTDKRPL